MPGHTGIKGNEEADNLAREGSKMTFIGPELVLPLATTSGQALLEVLLFPMLVLDTNPSETSKSSGRDTDGSEAQLKIFLIRLVIFELKCSYIKDLILNKA